MQNSSVSSQLTNSAVKGFRCFVQIRIVPLRFLWVATLQRKASKLRNPETKNGRWRYSYMHRHPSCYHLASSWGFSQIWLQGIHRFYIFFLCTKIFQEILVITLCLVTICWMQVEFWICLVLTLFGYIPGIIYAVYAITKWSHFSFCKWSFYMEDSHFVKAMGLSFFFFLVK